MTIFFTIIFLLGYVFILHWKLDELSRKIDSVRKANNESAENGNDNFSLIRHSCNQMVKVINDLAKLSGYKVEIEDIHPTPFAVMATKLMGWKNRTQTKQNLHLVKILKVKKSKK